MLHSSRLGDSPVTVAITPDGRADAQLGEDRFAMPLEVKMTFADFIKALRDPDGHPEVHYVQKQNSNLSDEFSILAEDTAELEWASSAFGKTPDAVNFWIGDSRAVTTSKKFARNESEMNVSALTRALSDPSFSGNNTKYDSQQLGTLKRLKTEASEPLGKVHPDCDAFYVT